jgi:hypothetical protein
VVLFFITSNKENNVVYIVMGGWDYEGFDLDSVQMFVTEREGREYGESLISVGGFDYYDLVIREVPSVFTR